ncbi:2-hydroxyacid dehydrogenase [uncultured Succinatimonas sp.]|uniref:2-hydroxyacid dehydrogenase n=1 Tax=uncultured Succinatimonas sp. TaxID=1262973 RepID=UPI0025E006BE|nr:2-hydroxyacid dehydrogenase [uncultured Succinatimonas sp.]
MTYHILKYTDSSLPDFLISEVKKRGEFAEKKALNADELKQAYEETDILLVSGGTIITKDTYDKFKNVKMIADFGVGYDGIDVNEAIKRNIFISHTPNVLNDDVANTAVALLMNTTRQMIEAQKFIERKDWENGAIMPLGVSFTGLKVGIAGLGRIGKEIAARLEAFKCDIAYFAHGKKDVSYKFFASLSDMASWCDALIIAMPSTKETFHCVNEEILQKLGPNGFLVNIARGALVDTDALIKALDNKIIAGAGLDVFEQEPKVPQELFNRPNVVLTPHIGSATTYTRMEMAKLVLANIDAFIAGKNLITKVPGTRDA